ncbi:MAG: type II toxin-antitoxin system RelE/ParE family toxin [Pirellulales bacterium]|nr:type II toxin-antitoxin system RelE/ParE family toxin [Pirellulales bacterium]
MKVVWSENAIAHLTDIFEYIARDSERYASRMVDRITSRSKQIGFAPESGQVVQEFEHPQVREVIEGPYRVIYRVESDHIVVLSVIHGARELPRHLE